MMGFGICRRSGGPWTSAADDCQRRSSRDEEEGDGERFVRRAGRRQLNVDDDERHLVPDAAVEQFDHDDVTARGVRGGERRGGDAVEVTRLGCLSECLRSIQRRAAVCEPTGLLR